MVETLKNVQRCIGQVEGIALMSEEVVRDVLMGAAESLSDGFEVLQKRVAAVENGDPRRVVVPEIENPNASAGCAYCESKKILGKCEGKKILGKDEERKYYIDGTGWLSHSDGITITQIAEMRYCPFCGRKL